MAVMDPNTLPQISAPHGLRALLVIQDGKVVDALLDQRDIVYHDGLPNGGEHCAPPGGPDNVCFRSPDGSCTSCGFPASP